MLQQLPLFLPESKWKPTTVLPALTGVKEVVIDCETNDNGLRTKKGPGWATKNGHVCGLGVAWAQDEKVTGVYLSITHPDSQNFEKAQIKRWLKNLWQRGVRFIFHNAAYDIGWLNADLDMPVPEKVDDTACMAYMIDENRLSYSLNALCKWKGLPGKQEGLLKEAAAAYGLDPKNELYLLPARFVGEYGQGDGLSTLMLVHSLRPQLKEENLSTAYETEMALIPMVHAMRQHGIRIDINRCEQLYGIYKKQSEEALQDISNRLGQTTSIDDIRSPSWLETAFRAEHLSFPFTQKTGRGSFEAKWMRKHEHWLPQAIVRAKSKEDAAEKFVKGYLLDFCHNGRIHPTINQYRGESHYEDEGRGGGTRTYRFSYADPPLQQIPARDTELAEIRSAFIAEEGEHWLKADYSQQEFRLMVHYANRLKLSGAGVAAQRYHDDPKTDFHALVAQMTGLDRKPAKDCNFAKAYGAGVAKFAAMIGQSEDKARKIMAQYDERLPFVKALFEHCQRTAEERGYIMLLDGARIRFNFWVAQWRDLQVKWTQENHMADCSREEAEKRIAEKGHPWFGRPLRRSRCNKAMNSLIQGGAARQTKIAMLAVWRAGYCPTLQLHDELCFSIANPKDAKEIAQIMREAVSLSVPMQVDFKVGASWAL